MGHGFLKPPQCRPHQNEARHKSGPSPKAATTDSGDGDSNSFVAFAESSNRYRSGLYESFDTTVSTKDSLRVRAHQYWYHLGSTTARSTASSPARTSSIGLS